MKTIREIYDQKPRTDGVGIEVEVESKTALPMEIGGVWLAKSDSSLRDFSAEYVCRQPIKVGPDTMSHIKVLTDKLNHADVKLNMSHRTSVHIHRNIQEFSPVQLWTTIIAYWMLEDPLMDYCGESRKGNLFCLPLSDCEGILKDCMNDIAESVPFSQFSKTRCKYGGQNLATIREFGSLEYRAMRGTCDPEIVHNWAHALYTLGERAKIFKDPAVLMDYYLDSSKDELLNALLPASFAEIVKKSPNYTGLIRENVLRLCDLAYAVDDWNAWENALEVLPKKTDKVKTLINTQPLATTSPQLNWPQGVANVPTISSQGWALTEWAMSEIET